MSTTASPIADQSTITIDVSQSIESVIVQLSSSPEDERAVVANVDDSCADALRLFTAFDLHHLPVVSGGYLKGIVSATDLLNLLTKRPGVALEGVRLSEIMSPNPRTIDREAPIVDAITELAESSYRCLPVLGGRGEPWSIITTRDLVRLLHRACVTE